MAVSNRPLREAFDFSQDESVFKKKLWKQLQANEEIQPLEDEELAWVNAAGMPYAPPSEEEARP